MEEMNEREIKIVKKSTLYDIRLIFSSSDKTEYTKDEILQILDDVALAKEQE